jgi:hypothetical protein
MPEQKRGSCLCGRVTFTVSGDLHPPDACHCVQCRKQSGHYFASTNVPRALLAITGEETLSWYKSSAKIRRGFCSICGSFLFWDPIEMDLIAIVMGAFDAPTSTQLAKHIFVTEKGDYYRIDDALPQSMAY